MSLIVRPALHSDSSFFYALRTYSEYQEFFDGPGPSNIDEHEEWYAQRLKDPLCTFLLAEVNGSPAGYVRFNKLINRSAYEISYALSPLHLGKGWGVKLICESVSYLMCEACLKLETIIIARIKPSNFRSRMVALRAGFMPAEREVERLLPPCFTSGTSEILSLRLQSKPFKVEPM